MLLARTRPAQFGASLGPLLRAATPHLAAAAEAQAGRWALWLPLFMTAGSVLALTARSEPPAWLGAALCAGMAGLAVGLRRWRWVRMAPLAGLALGLGLLSAQRATWRAAPLLDAPRRAVTVTGTVTSAERLPVGWRVMLAGPALRAADAPDDAPPAARAVRLHLRDPPDGVAPPRAGDRLRVRAMLSRPSPPAVPGGWDLRRDAFFAGIGAYGYALGPAETLGHAGPVGIAPVLDGLRQAIAGRIDAALPPEQAAVAVTLLTGSASAMPAADRQAFRDSGLAHLLAIAGLHVGIVMGLVFGATRLGLAAVPYLALRWPTKAIAAVASVAAGGLYMLVTGAHVPILRSFAMACLVLLALLTGRRAVSLRALALAMAAVVLIAPNEVLGVSFQMSFSAVLALIAGYAALRPWLRRLHGGGWARRLAGHVVALALTSALAGTASTPYGAYHFGHVQLYYVVANMVAVPLTALWVMPLGLLALALMPFGLQAAALVPMGWGELAILWVGRTVASWPDAVVAVLAPSPAGLIALSLGLAWLGIWRGPIRLAGLAGIAAGVLSAATARPADILVSGDGRLVGMRLAGAMFVEQHSGASAFTRDAWQAYWAADAPVVLPRDGTAADGAVVCDPRGCDVRQGGAVVRIARGPPGPADCAATLIVAAEPVRLRCPGGATIVDRFTVWRQGAVAAWLDRPGPARLLSVRDVTGERAWAPPPVSSRAAPGLPLAVAE